MLLFPEHPEYSASAERERCPEARDVFVLPEHRRKGAARAIMGELEEAAREQAFRRVGLSVAIDVEAAPARELYESLGYVKAHGPFMTSATLEQDAGPIPVGATLVFLVKELR